MPAGREADRHEGQLGSRYDIRSPLGEGGMARVFLGVARAPGGFARRVAIKRLHRHLALDEGATRRFAHEARIQSSVYHANVVGVHDVGRDDEGPFMVLDWIDGDSLRGLDGRARTNGERLPARVVNRVLLDALRGLHAAHEARDELGRELGILHRDVTPENILVGRDGVARLTDFGVANAAGSLSLDDKGMVVGKMTYMAPEYLRRELVDAHMDVYAMGVTAWVLYSGEKPWPERDLVRSILELGVPELDRRLAIAPELRRIVQRACRPDMHDRFPSARAMADALEAAATAAGALATHAEVGDAVDELMLTEHRSGARLSVGRVVEEPKGWELLGVDENAWREEAPTSREGVAAARPSTAALAVSPRPVSPPAAPSRWRWLLGLLGRTELL